MLSRNGIHLFFYLDSIHYICDGILFCQRTGTLFHEQKYQIFQYKIENRSLNIICFRYSNLLKIKFQICLTLIYLFTLLKNIKIQSLGIVVTKAKTK